jgi:hypothetical protein
MKTTITTEIKNEILTSIAQLQKVVNNELNYSIDLRNVEKINKYNSTIQTLNGYLKQGWL